MKKIILLAVLLPAFIACNNTKQPVAADAEQTVAETAADSLRPAEDQPEEAAAKTEGFVLTDQGVGPIKLGMPAADIPAAVEGLYDRTAREMAADDEIVTCYLNNQSVVTAEIDEDDNVGGISVSTEAPVKIQTSSGEAYISK